MDLRGPHTNRHLHRTVKEEAQSHATTRPSHLTVDRSPLGFRELLTLESPQSEVSVAAPSITPTRWVVFHLFTTFVLHYPARREPYLEDRAGCPVNHHDIHPSAREDHNISQRN